jgi:hypothetical protein
MDDYVLKVSPTPRLIAGLSVHLAKFAYKPYHRSEYDDKLWARCQMPANEQAWAILNKASGYAEVMIVHVHDGKWGEGAPVHRMKTHGSMYDGALDAAPVGHLHKRGGKWVYVPVA